MKGDFDMNKIEIRTGIIEEDNSNVSVIVEGNSEDNRDLVIQGILTLISTLDYKHTYDTDDALYNQDFEKLLFAVVDNRGYQDYYWSLPKEETHYNKEDELVIDKKAKINYLKMIIEDLEETENRKSN